MLHRCSRITLGQFIRFTVSLSGLAMRSSGLPWAGKVGSLTVVLSGPAQPLSLIR